MAVVTREPLPLLRVFHRQSGQGSPRCERCLSAGHATDDCSLPGEEDPNVSKRLRAIESAVVALTQAKPPAATSRPQMAELCRKFNEGKCVYPWCQRTHKCSECRGGHPAIECTSRGSRPDPRANTSPAGPSRIPPRSRSPNGEPPTNRRAAPHELTPDTLSGMYLSCS